MFLFFFFRVPVQQTADADHRLPGTRRCLRETCPFQTEPSFLWAWERNPGRVSLSGEAGLQLAILPSWPPHGPGVCTALLSFGTRRLCPRGLQCTSPRPLVAPREGHHTRGPQTQEGEGGLGFLQTSWGLGLAKLAPSKTRRAGEARAPWTPPPRRASCPSLGPWGGAGTTPRRHGQEGDRCPGGVGSGASAGCLGRGHRRSLPADGTWSRGPGGRGDMGSPEARPVLALSSSDQGDRRPESPWRATGQGHGYEGGAREEVRPLGCGLRRGQ